MSVDRKKHVLENVWLKLYISHFTTNQLFSNFLVNSSLASELDFLSLCSKNTTSCSGSYFQPITARICLNTLH